MNQELSGLLTDLKSTVTKALRADDIAAAVAALEQAVHQVSVSLDVTIQEGRGRTPVAKDEVTPVSSGALKLSATDCLFLKVLGIATDDCGN